MHSARVQDHGAAIPGQHHAFLPDHRMDTHGYGLVLDTWDISRFFTLKEFKYCPEK
jgi:hypothetical protein